MNGSLLCKLGKDGRDGRPMAGSPEPDLRRLEPCDSVGCSVAGLVFTFWASGILSYYHGSSKGIGFFRGSLNSLGFFHIAGPRLSACKTSCILLRLEVVGTCFAK